MERYLNATYLGRDIDETRSSKHPDGRYYKLPMNIDGKNIIAYIVVQYKPRYDGGNETAPTIKTVAWYDLEDPEFDYEFKKRGYDRLCFESDDKIKFERAYVEQDKILDILDLQVPLPYEYVPNSNQTLFAQNYRTMFAKINSELFENKKRLIIESRKNHFLSRLREAEENNPEIKLSNVMREFDERERETAFKLYDNMIFCIMRGKYSFNDYRVFMRNLPNIIRGNGILLAGNQVRRIINTEGKISTRTFVIPTDRELAGQCPTQRELITERAHKKSKEKIIDVNYGSDYLVYYTIARNSHNRHAIQVDGIEEAIGTLGKFSICPGSDGEVLFMQGKRKPRHFKMPELV